MPLHPTQLYLSASAFLVFLILQWAYRRKTFDGEVFWLYVLLYAITRGILETWRGDLVRGFVIPDILSTSQFIGLLTAGLAAGMLFYLSRRSRATPRTTTGPCFGGSGSAPPPPARGSTVFLASACSDLSRSRIQKLVAEGAVRVDGTAPKRSHTVRRAGEEVSVEVPEPRRGALEAENIPLTILYEDEDLHRRSTSRPVSSCTRPPDTPRARSSMRCCHHVRDLAGIGGEPGPGSSIASTATRRACCWWPRPTSRTSCISRQMRKRTLRKEYLALVAGVPRVRKGEVSLAVGRDPRDRKKMKAFRASAGETPAGARDARTLYEIETRLASPGADAAALPPRDGPHPSDPRPPRGGGASRSWAIRSTGAPAFIGFETPR